MDEEPRVSPSTWTWVFWIVVWIPLIVWACVSCSGSMVEQARDGCHRAGGKFAAQRGTATAPDGTESPAILMVCVFKGVAA